MQNAEWAGPRTGAPDGEYAGKASPSKGEAVSRRLTDEGCFGVLLCPPPHPPQCAHWGTFPQGKAWKSPLSQGCLWCVNAPQKRAARPVVVPYMAHCSGRRGGTEAAPYKVPPPPKNDNGRSLFRGPAVFAYVAGFPHSSVRLPSMGAASVPWCSRA